MTRPLVSIGFPVYNGAATVASALRSLLEQDDPDVEILVSDNASTDGTGAAIAAAVAGDPRVLVRTRDRLVPAPENFRGVLERARGELFMWAAADDLWSPNYVSSLRAALEARPEAILATPSVVYLRKDGAVLPGRGGPAPGTGSIDNLRTLLHERTQSWMYGLHRTAALRAHAEDLLRRHPYGGDMIWLASLCLRAPLAGAPEAVIYKRTGRNSLEARGVGIVVFPTRLAWGLTRVSLAHGRGPREKAAALGLVWSRLLGHWMPRAATQAAQGIRRRLPGSGAR